MIPSITPILMQMRKKQLEEDNISPEERKRRHKSQMAYYEHQRNLIKESKNRKTHWLINVFGLNSPLQFFLTLFSFLAAFCGVIALSITLFIGSLILILSVVLYLFITVICKEDFQNY